MALDFVYFQVYFNITTLCVCCLFVTSCLCFTLLLCLSAPPWCVSPVLSYPCPPCVFFRLFPLLLVSSLVFLVQKILLFIPVSLPITHLPVIHLSTCLSCVSAFGSFPPSSWLPCDSTNWPEVFALVKLLTVLWMDDRILTEQIAFYGWKFHSSPTPCPVFLESVTSTICLVKLHAFESASQPAS